MQITLNKVAFDVRAVEGRTRAAILADPVIAPGVSRDVWAWDGAAGRALAPVTPQGGLVIPTGLTFFVPRAGANGGEPQKAEGPTRKMAERFLAAVGAKSFAQVMQGFARVAGVPQLKLPLDAFADVKAQGPFTIRAETDYAVVELASNARNLAAYAVLPGLVVFTHHGAAQGAPEPGSIKPGFILPPPTEVALAMRRLAAARRLTEMQAELGETKPRDLAADDPRRAEVARIGAEWRVLAPKKAA